MRKFGCLSMLLGALAFATPHVSAQLSITTAVDLALRNNPKVKMAQADLDKAKAALAEVHDAYVPAVITAGGYGKSTGVPTSLPVVFSIEAQSLIFNYSQKDYVRSANAGVMAANLALSEARTEAAEDAVTTYVSLSNAQQRRAALTQGSSFAGRLVQIVQDRFDTGIEPHSEVTRSKRTSVQLHLQQLVVEDEIASLAEHLGRITGVFGSKTETVPDSIPAFVPPSEATGSLTDSDGIRAMFANATAKSLQAHGDARYRLRPQLAFSAGYSRISTVGSSYGDYYPRFANNNYSHNSFDIAVQFSIPIVDLVHQAKARGSAAEARRAQFDAEVQRNTFFEGRLKLQHAAAEIAARVELASLDRDMAQDELEKIQIQLKSAPGSAETPQMSPKDEQNARLQERQKYIEYLDADLQLRQTQIMLLRQNGQLGEWLHTAIVAPATAASGSLPTAPSAGALPVTHP